MPPLKDLTGKKFGHLTVIKQAPNKGSHVTWECLCDCGNITIVRGDNLTREKYKTTTCGCRIGKSIIGEQYGTLTIIEDLGNNNFYKVTGTVSGTKKAKKVVAIIQKNRLDSTLGFSIKALKWSK